MKHSARGLTLATNSCLRKISSCQDALQCVRHVCSVVPYSEAALFYSTHISPVNFSPQSYDVITGESVKSLSELLGLNKKKKTCPGCLLRVGTGFLLTTKWHFGRGSAAGLLPKSYCTSAGYWLTYLCSKCAHYFPLAQKHWSRLRNGAFELSDENFYTHGKLNKSTVLLAGQAPPVCPG